MSARQYFARSARYVFQTEDSSLVRFAPMQTKGISKRATVRDLSETGLSFMLPLTESVESLPEEGAALKVEFPVPGRSSIACFATVTRVEQRTEFLAEWGDRGYHLIALQFRHLPSLHLRAIQRGLGGKVSDEASFDSVMDLNQVRRTHSFAFAGMSVALFASCYALTFSAHTWAKTLFHLVK